MNIAEIKRFSSLGTGDEVRKFFVDCVSNFVEADLTFEAGPTTHQTVVCHVCKGGFRSFAVDEQVGQNVKQLFTHRGCYDLRAGLSTSEIMFGLRLGYWVHMQWMDEGTTTWRATGLDLFLEECGHRIKDSIELCRLDADELLGENPEPSSYLRFVRAIYLEEREAPKWEALGSVVPKWNENSMNWSDYKEHVFMPAYKQLPERPKRNGLPSVTNRTGGLCALCGGEFSNADELLPESDHIVPHVKGGSDDSSNLQPLHSFCNGSYNSVGPGDIPLALMIGRWMMGQIEHNKAHWLDTCLNQYATKLRSNARRKAN
jgi:5-methylcytosine-specific restriction endonuclease McrA